MARQPPQTHLHDGGDARSLSPKYSEKVQQFFAKLLDAKNAGKPLMRPYLEGYWDLYWDLHLGVKGDDVPQKIRQVGNSFNTVLAYRDPTQKIVYENYMTVRSNLGFLKSWIDLKLDELNTGRIPAPEKTFAQYWIKNGGDGENFKRKDVVFECFHNFVAFSQWGNTIYNIMLKLSRNHGDPEAQDWFKKTMEGNPDGPAARPSRPLERFVMELFRSISPNGGSISALEEMRTPPLRGMATSSPRTQHQHRSRALDEPEKFDPSRYNARPDQPRDRRGKAKQIGFAKCPFDVKTFDVKDGRKVSLQQQRVRHGLWRRRWQSRCLSVTMQALHRSVSAIVAAPASSSPSRRSRISCAKCGRTRSSS